VTWNLICLCGHHHRMHHQGLLGITGNADQPDGVVFTTANGRVLRPSGTAAPPTTRPDPPTYRGPTGERLRKDHVWFNRRRAETRGRPSAPVLAP
jgi:hypothetical protein